MASTEDLRKRITDPTPLYAVAGAADLAAEKLKEAPALFDRLVAEAPGRIAAVRDTNPKVVQERVSQQAQQTQAKLSELLSGLDTDLKKLRETAQDLTLQGVGRVAEYAVRARDTYDELAVRGRGAVQTWLGEESDEEAEADAPGELGTARDTAPPRTRPTHRIATPPPATPARPARPARPAATPATPAPADGAKGGGTTKANGTAKANGSAAASAGGTTSAGAPATTADATTKDGTAKDAPASATSAGAPETGGSADGTRPTGQRPAAPKPAPPGTNPKPNPNPGPDASANPSPNGDPTVRKPAPKSAE
ncbi:hypothetical protein [Streptomyces sp. 71268]|uniref:hypothetical protein n=1 Tax=Streptomyces sp. 71268 TaxID=3002640 RepID=UPI0032B2718C